MRDLNPIERLCARIPDRHDHAVGIIFCALLGALIGLAIIT